MQENESASQQSENQTTDLSAAQSAAALLAARRPNPFEQLPLYKRLDWPTTGFLLLTPLLAFTLTPIYIVAHELSWKLIFLCVIYGGITNLCITAGYHRLLAHQSYQTPSWVRFLYLLFGAAAWQGSALKWCSDHRRHHRFVDTDQDPYNINRGFFYAHVGWMFLKDDPQYKNQFAVDLMKDKMMMFQHRHFVVLASVMGFGLPLLVGYLMGSPWGGLIFGGILRVVVTHHTTFFINSFCHIFGRQTYGTKNSARDSLILALFTHGEGYHNFHHHFQADYRNGIRWFDWDPTKWLIGSLSAMGLARKLKRTSKVEILKARLREEERQLLGRGVPADHLANMRARVEESMKRWQQLKVEYKVKKTEYAALHARKSEEIHARLDQIKSEIQLAKHDFKMNMQTWVRYMKRRAEMARY